MVAPRAPESRIALVVVLVLAVIATAPFALIALGVALAAAILLLDAALLTVGEATWGDVAWDLAGLALSAVGGRADHSINEARQLSWRLQHAG